MKMDFRVLHCEIVDVSEAWYRWKLNFKADLEMVKIEFQHTARNETLAIQSILINLLSYCYDGLMTYFM